MLVARKKKREKKKEKTRQSARIKRYIRFSREYLRSRRIENDESYTNGEERPPCNTLKSSFPLPNTLKNEKCETRAAVQVDSGGASILWIF